MSRRDGQTPPPDPDPWLTAGEVAELLRVSPATVYRLVDARELQSKRIRRSVRIRRSWVTAYLRANQVTELPVTPPDGQPRPPPGARDHRHVGQGPGLA
ncbi:hypothetical protein DQ240_18400 [Blastococcus sp. TF02A-26]|nr:hypothetical protein DQ240_18400 [Blastococcus sp. TF02A-26]